MAYELYSWPDSSAGWNFCLAPSPSGVYMTAEQIFGKKSTIRGVGELNQRVSQLPGGTTIYWLERIPPDADPKTKDSKSLRYPPEDVIQQVRRHAQLRDVRIQF